MTCDMREFLLQGEINVMDTDMTQPRTEHLTGSYSRDSFQTNNIQKCDISLIYDLYEHFHCLHFSVQQNSPFYDHLSFNSRMSCNKNYISYVVFTVLTVLTF